MFFSFLFLFFYFLLFSFLFSFLFEVLSRWTDGDVLYTAEILSHHHDAKDGDRIYKIHFVGWGKKYDKWVGEDDLAPFDEEGTACFQLFRRFDV